MRFSSNFKTTTMKQQEHFPLDGHGKQNRMPYQLTDENAVSLVSQALVYIDWNSPRTPPNAGEMEVVRFRRA